MIYVCKSKCMFKSELWIFTEKIGNTLHGLGKFHLGIFAVKKVSESCPINNFQVKLWVEKQNSCSQRKVSFATTCARYVSPCSTFPSKLGQSIDASFVRILGCPGEQRGFSIILSATDGWWPGGFLKASLGSLQPEQANFSSYLVWFTPLNEINIVGMNCPHLWNDYCRL